MPLGHIIGQRGVRNEKLGGDFPNQNRFQTFGTFLILRNDIFIKPIALTRKLVGFGNMVEHGIMADHLAGLKLIGEPVTAIMVHERVLFGLFQENINVFVYGICLLMVKEFQEIILQFGLKRGDIDEEEAEAITNVKDYEELIAMLQKDKLNDNKGRDFIKTRGY